MASRRTPLAKKYGITDQQVKFCHEFLKTLSLKTAAIDSGYSRRSAKTRGVELFKLPGVQACVQHLVEQRSERTNIELDEVVQELHRRAFRDPREIMTWGHKRLKDGTVVADEFQVILRDSEDLAPEVARQVKGLHLKPGKFGDSLKIELVDSQAALFKLGEHLGLKQSPGRFDQETMASLAELWERKQKDPEPIMPNPDDIPEE